MKYAVNENCISCELCTTICPEVFAMGEEGFAQAMDGEAPADCEDSAAEAMESCPVDAIEKIS